MANIEENYGKVLLELGIAPAVIEESQRLLAENPLLYAVLKNPTVTKEEKHRVIEAVFPKEIHHFLNVLCNHGGAHRMEAIGRAYEQCRLEEANLLEVELSTAHELSEEQLDALGQRLQEDFHKDGVTFIKRQDPSLIGGFLCRVGDKEYDYSMKGRLRRLHRRLVEG